MVEMLDRASVSNRVRSASERPALPQSDDSAMRLVRRLLESFFRRPLACLLPLLLLTTLGVYSVSGSEQRFVSSGVLSVSNETLLSSLTNVRLEAGFTFESPAQVTSRGINELLGTDVFAREVAVGAGLGDVVDNGTIELAGIRQAVGAGAIGSNLVKISASTDDPGLSKRLVDSTLTTFIDWVIDGDIRQSTTAQGFFDELLVSYESDAQAARTALDDYYAEHPEPLTGPRPASERAIVSRLTADVQLAEDRYGSVLQSSQDARLATQQTMVDVDQRLRVVDAPVVPSVPESSRTEQILTVGMFMIAGLIFSMGLIILGALLDRSIRSAQDVRARLRIEVLAVVPDARR